MLKDPNNSITGNRSKYIIEEYRLDPRHFGLNSFGKYQLKENQQINFGLHVSRYMSKNYRLMNDLLGGDYWVDIDQFAEQDFEDPNLAQNDLQEINRVVYNGDIFGYNYNIHFVASKNEAFGEYNLNTSKIESYAGLTLSNSSFWKMES